MGVDKPMIEETKIIELIRSYEDGRTMKLDALSVSQAREEEHIKNIDEKIDLLMKAMEKNDDKYCPMYIEKIVWGIGAVVGIWVINQLLDMIPKAHAIFISYLH